MQTQQTHTQQEFQRLSTESAPQLRRIAYRLSNSAEDAEDLVQESLFKAWRGFASFQRESAFSTWVTRILMNTWKDSKKKKHTNVYQLDASMLEQHYARHSFSDVHDAVNRFLDELPEQQRAVFVLRCLEDLSVKETATMLDIAQGTVKVQYFRALKRMRELLGAEHKEWKGGAR